MKAFYSEELIHFLKDKRHKNIVVEVATADTSDFDVTEIFLRRCNHKHAEYLKNQGYKEVTVDGLGQNESVVLIKPYRMHIDPEIRFGLEKKWLFNRINYEGIRL